MDETFSFDISLWEMFFSAAGGGQSQLENAPFSWEFKSPLLFCWEKYI